MGLTKEEKKAQRAANKEAAEARKKAIRRKLKIDELEREMTAHNLWREELNQTWREAMLKLKIPAYRKQIQVICHAFNRAYDKKDRQRDLIMHLRAIANNQYQRTIASFCEVTGNIINSFLSDLEEMCNQNELKTAEILKQNQIEVAFLLEYKRRAETHLQLLLYTSHKTADLKAWNTKGENMVRKDVDASKYLERLEKLKYTLEGDYVAVWEEYKSTLKSYIHSTAQNQKQLKVLRKKEQMMTEIIAAQARKLINSQVLIKRLRLELLSFELGEKQAGFRDRQNRHRDAYKRQKKFMSEGVEIDHQRMNTLVKASDETTEWVEAAQKKCEKILRLATLCRKFETQREKILPYGIVLPPEQEKMDVHSQPHEPLLADAFSTTCGLTKLWQRISKAELSKIALIREKTILERENAIMEHQSKQNDDKINFPNIIKCPCTQIRASKRSFQPHAVDGNLEIKKFIR